MLLLGGHPYLTRYGLHRAVIEKKSLDGLIQVANTANGPFTSHLRRQLSLLTKQPELLNIFKKILFQKDIHDEWSLIRLHQFGLIKVKEDQYVCRCELYRSYFKDKL